jgi:signal transduction histidine kinase
MHQGGHWEDDECMATVEPVAPPARWRRPNARPWWRAAGGLLLLAALAGAWLCWVTFAQSSLPWDSTRIGAAVYPESEWRDGVVLHTVLDPTTTPLRTDDRVVEIDGVPIADWVVAHRGEHFDVGDRLSYTVIRDGQPRTFEVALTTYNWGDVLRFSAATLAVELVLIVVAVAVIVARPRDPAARVLFAVAATAPFGSPEWPFRGSVLGLTLTPWPMWPQLVAGLIWALVWGAMIPHFALVFPKPPAILAKRRWMVPALYAAPLLVYGAYLAATLPMAANSLERAERVSAIWVVTQRYAPLAVIVLITWAYLRTRGTDDRQRVALVVLSVVAAFAVNLFGVQLPRLIAGESALPREFRYLLFLLVPVAIAVAILRHQLFDIRVVLRRSLLAAMLAGAVGGIYVLCLLLVGHPTRSERPYFLIGTAAALVLPGLYRWLRAAVTHRVYGARDDPYKLVEQIVNIEPVNDPQLMLQRLARTLSEALHLAYVAISLNERDRVMRASHGTSEGTLHRVALVSGREEVGFIELDVGHGREPFGPADQGLLAAIATHAAATISATTLNLDLHESRTRLVTSREDERRRIRKDLHDGVGPKLALLSMNLEVIKELIATDPDSAKRLVDAAGDRAHEAISEVRRVVSNLRPAVLDELGLVGAVGLLTEQTTDAHRHQLDGALHVTLEAHPADGLEELPAAVEVAAYRIISEAVNNASRHAHANQCRVCIGLDGALQISVCDNGTGISAHAIPGTGISSIHKRASELGGTASVQPSPGGGTVVTATIPLQPTES